MEKGLGRPMLTKRGEVESIPCKTQFNQNVPVAASCRMTTRKFCRC